MNDTPQRTAYFESNVVGFRPRDATAFPRKVARHAPTDNIYKLLDLSRYESRDHSRHDPDFRQNGSDDYGHRMRVNIAALIFLAAIVGLGVADVVKLEQAQITDPAETALVLSNLI